MGNCHQCNSPIEPSATTCQKCGARLSVAADNFATLNESERTPTEYDFSLDGDDRPKQKELEIQETLNLVPETRKMLETGVEPFSELGISNESSPSDSSGTSETMDDPESLRKASDSSSDDSSDSQTVQLPEQPKTDQIGRNATLIYSEHDQRRTDRGRRSEGSSQVSEGHLKRVWDAAIGSSGQDSRQSLRHERAEASDSVFRRVATRVVTEADGPDLDSADYQIRDKLGEGGMGVVYSAIQTTVNRIVAIKSIRKDKRESDKSRNQFFYEAEITADLDHPNIPPIYDLGTTKDGLLFYSMKLIDGIEWQKVISKKSREENLDIFKKVSDAVAFAHSKGVIHRDLKPDNVMLGKYGEVYVTDWGLAFNLKRRRSVDFGGTPDYMSPEMAKNRQSKIGKASDIYLLGAILFQTLTGSPPHIGRKVLQRLAAAEKNEIAPTNVDDTLLEIAYRAMATETTDRYASVEEMQEAIRQIRLHEESITLAHRAEEAVGLATSSKDYDQFTRAIFGYRDAIELWSENQAAKRGLQKARLAFAQCAFDKGDNDLVLQTLDQKSELEFELYNKAAQAKASVLQREQRFKTLRRTFAAAVLAFLCIATGLAGFASLKWRGEIKQRDAAVVAAANEKQAKDEAVKEKEEANIARATAETAKIEADNARQDAENSAEEEKKAKLLALQEQRKAENSAEEERKAKQAAEAAAEGERMAKIAEQKRSAQIQIGDYQSKLGLAKLQVEQFDIRGASQLLDALKEIPSTGFGDSIPRFDSWGWQRIKLLTNADLPRKELGGRVTALAFANGSDFGIAGTETGSVHLVRYQDGKLTIESSIENPGCKVETVAISALGDEAVFCVVAPEKNQLFVWPLQPAAKPKNLESTQNRRFQDLSYSPDASRLVGGINGGIWLWERKPDWVENKAAKEFLYAPNIRGQMTSLQWVDDNRIIAISILNGKPSLFGLNLNVADKNKRLDFFKLPAEISERLTTVFPLHGNRLLFGLNDGSMLTADWISGTSTDTESAESTIGNVLELPKKHRVAISRIIANRTGGILSMSDEPVSHVWLTDGKGGMTYDTYLTGAPSTSGSSNISQAAFVSDNAIVGVDSQGSAIAWDLARQKQRRQLERQATLENEEYASPVVGVFSRGQRQEALSITQDGVVDLWNLHNGRTIKIGDTRWSYFGHTPGAEYVDSAVDLASGLVVTSASLKNLTRSEKRYLRNPTHNWEFCVWDQRTGNMLQRWTETSDESVEFRLSIIESGKQLLISSDSITRIVDFSGSPVFLKKNLGTYFAVPNPKYPGLTAMVKRSGFTWLWNRNSPETSWEKQPPPFVSDDENGDGFPIKGSWSVDGQRLFLVYSNGTIYSYDRNEYRVSQNWRRKKVWPQKLGRETNDSVAQVRFHYDIDLAIATERDRNDILYVNIRTPGNASQTQLSVIRYDTKTNQSEYLRSESLTKPGILWLEESIHSAPRLSNELHSRFKVNERSRDSILSKISVGQHTFVSTRTGKVYDLAENAVEWVSLGRNPLLSSTASRDGDVLWTLHNDGSLWYLKLVDGKDSHWQRAEWTALDCHTIRLSPNGDQLAILGNSHTLKIVATSTGEVLGTFEGVARAVWDLENLLVGNIDGTMVSIRGKEKLLLGTIELDDGRRIQDMHVFTESWTDPNVDPEKYLLIQSESETDGSLNFLPLDARQDDAERNGFQPRLPSVRQPISKGLRIATSPTDPIFVTGNESGTVSVWFASPKWDRLGVLFDLEGHRGSAIESATFSNDGHTLITSDRRNRLYGWLSREIPMDR